MTNQAANVKKIDNKIDYESMNSFQIKVTEILTSIFRIVKEINEEILSINATRIYEKEKIERK